MAAEKHIIKKAIVELYIPSANNAMELQNKALVFFKETISPMIESIIAKYSDPSQTIRIDKLELDLHNFNPVSPNENELKKLEQQIEDKLIKLIAQEKSDNFSGEILPDVKKISGEKADEELAICLLKTGSLPWWAKTEQVIRLEALVQKVLEQSSPSFKNELTSALAFEAVRQRVVSRLSVATIKKVVSFVIPASSGLLNSIHEIIRFIKEHAVVSTSAPVVLYEYALKYAVSSFSVSLDLRSFLLQLVKEKDDFYFVKELYKLSNADAGGQTAIAIKEALAAADGHFSGSVKKLFTVSDIKLFFDVKETHAHSKAQQSGAADENNNLTLEEEKQQEISKARQQTEENKDSAALEETKSDSAKAANKTVKDPEQLFESIEESVSGDYFIRNSGLIILSPYLPAVFKELGLCDGKAFVSDEAAMRAVYILQYLATGNEADFEEHEMILNKILCGISVSTPLTLQFTISAKEKEECLGLLQAVADNWPALKGTSGEGMRDAFFMRDGILEQQSNGWDLKIEKTTIDILLDKLPWGISILQMPWNKELIFVSW